MNEQVNDLFREILAAHFPSAQSVKVTLSLPETIGFGAKYKDSLDLSDEDKAVVNAHHIRKQGGDFIVRDTPELRRALRIPE
jgi:hypothetical protein